MRISRTLWQIIILVVFVAIVVSAYLYQRKKRVVSSESSGQSSSPTKPHQGRLAFIANPDGNWELFVMDGDGTELTQLTQTPLDERTPAISPSGEQVAYSTSDGTLWLMTIATKATEQVPLTPGRYGYPAWLQDGSGIVFTAYKFTPGNEDADFQVYSFRDHTQQPFLTQTGPQDFAALSPRDNSLAYVSSIATVLPHLGSKITQQLWLVAQDSKPVQLSVGSSTDAQPSWSPDAKWIAFSSGRAGTSDLWMISLDGQILKQLTSAPTAETSPSWSPDGREIVYVSTDSAGRMQLMTLDTSTLQSKPLSPFGSRPVDLKDPHWR